jgi:hypothetical protein
MTIHPQVLEDAQSSDPERRSAAVDALLAIGPEGVPLVVASLRSAGPYRWLVAERMVLQGASLAPVFRDLLQNEADGEIRILSALALYTLGEPRGEDVLLDAIRSGSEWEVLAVSKLAGAKSERLYAAVLDRLRTIPARPEHEATIARLLQVLIDDAREIPRQLRWRFSRLASPYWVAPLLEVRGSGTAPSRRGTRRILRTLALIATALLALALGVDALVGVAQPSFEAGAAEGVLRTFDEAGRPRESRLVVIDDGGTLWLQSAHHLRGWYSRLLRNPDVELIRDGETRAYRAVPLDTPETEARIETLLKRRTGAVRYYLIRTLLLFADVKPVRLDPRDAR